MATLAVSLQDDDRMPEAAIVKYFAENKDAVLQQIDNARIKQRPVPTVQLVREISSQVRDDEKGRHCHFLYQKDATRIAAFLLTYAVQIGLEPKNGNFISRSILFCH